MDSNRVHPLALEELELELLLQLDLTDLLRVNKDLLRLSSNSSSDLLLQALNSSSSNNHLLEMLKLLQLQVLMVLIREWEVHRHPSHLKDVQCLLKVEWLFQLNLLLVSEPQEQGPELLEVRLQAIVNPPLSIVSKSRVDVIRRRLTSRKAHSLTLSLRNLCSSLLFLPTAPGDRSHIPEAQKPIFGCLSRELARLKSTSPPGQKRMVEDTERRLNILFDALNCGTLDEKLIGGLGQLVGGE